MDSVKKIKINKGSHTISFRLPGNWQSVNRRVLKRIAPIVLAEHNTLDDQRIKLLHAACGLNVKNFFDIVAPFYEDEFEYDIAVFSQLLDEVEFLNEINFKNDVVGNIGIFPFLLKGTGNGLKNLNLDQWIFSGIFSQSYFNTHKSKDKKELLNQLFASLYSPWFMPWAKWMFKPLMLMANMVSSKTKLAILVNYIGLKANLLAANPHLFSKGKNPNFEELITDLAGAKFGTAKEVGSAQARLVITFLNKQIKEHNNRKG